MNKNPSLHQLAKFLSKYVLRSDYVLSTDLSSVRGAKQKSDIITCIL